MVDASWLEADYEIRNIDEWIKRFPFEQYSKSFHEGTTSWDNIVEVCVLEQYRQHLREAIGPLAEIPVDLFLMAQGEPQRRDVTKIGGVPYRPAALAWPKSAEGDPMTFVAQFRLSESRDHVAPVVSDMLLAFVSTPELHGGECTEQLHFEWFPLGLTDLAQESELPPPMFEFATCYGVRYRTTCITDSAAIAFVERDLQKWVRNDFRRKTVAKDICLIGATKIGGVPVSYSDKPLWLALPRFLATLGAIVPRVEVDYPWMNHPSPLPLDALFDFSESLPFFDTGQLDLYLDDNNIVRSVLECP